MSELIVPVLSGDVKEPISAEVELLARAFALYDGCDIAFDESMRGLKEGIEYKARVNRAKMILDYLRDHGYELKERR